MINIIWDHSFKKVYAKKIKSKRVLKAKFWDTLEIFLKNPFNVQLRTHKLSGKLAGLWAFSVTYDCRVIFKFLQADEVLLIDIGSHDEVY